jgi:acetylornithine deacetylase
LQIAESGLQIESCGLSLDLTDVVKVAAALVDIDSTTGNEGDVVLWTATLLSQAGYDVVEQVVQGPRRNLYAASGKADVVFSTHLDCVPTFFPSKLVGDTLYGRGSCDAKGAAASQIAALERLRREGRTNVGVLLVVGEERGSDGAKTAQALASGSKYLINGEPTDNRLGIGTRGILRVNLKAEGRAAHSSFPELGDSAVEKLIDALLALRDIELPDDQLMGRTHYNVGVLNGGVAPNVVPAAAEAEVMFRTVGDLPGLRRSLKALERWVTIEEVLEVPPITMPSVPGFETATFPYTTDIPFLSTWGTPLLFGPGSIHVAHTDNEHVKVAELHKAVDGYMTLAKHLLST